MIIGLGSGRCGTESLANLLNRQIGASVTHEYCSMPWEFDEKIWKWNMGRFLSGEKPYNTEIIGDVGFYWLNYVGRLLELQENAKFVCLKRDKQETIDSYMKKSNGLNVHPTDDRFRLFPRYSPPLKEAVGAMWDDYYRIAESWREKYPGSFLIMDMDEALNTSDGMMVMMEHLGIKNPIIHTGIKLNVSEGDCYGNR